MRNKVKNNAKFYLNRNIILTVLINVRILGSGK